MKYKYNTSAFPSRGYTCRKCNLRIISDDDGAGDEDGEDDEHDDDDNEKTVF